MPTFKKHFSRVNQQGTMSPLGGTNSNHGNWNNPQQHNAANHAEMAFRNYASRLPEVYVGHPNRIERYNQYEAMNCDSEINACLDIIAEFSTQKNQHNNTPFNLQFKEDPTPHEIELLKTQLQQWTKLNEFNNRIFKLFRNVIKYGDQVFVRDPENFKLYWVDMTKVVKVIVNESAGKVPEQYVIKDINLNLENLTVAQKTATDYAANPATGLGGSGGGSVGAYTVPAMPYNTTGSRFTLGVSENAIDAKHIVHLSLTEGMDRFWPFGQSILEDIFKVYKQKELLEDAVLIYRITRAPERRIFKIDVGNMPAHLAMAFVERVKNEVHQRRIPSLHGGNSVMDATYNPLSTNEDYFFPVTADGRGSSVETLAGGCFSMDTKVSLLDGRELSISEIEEEMKADNKLWTYSCEPLTGKIVPGLITWAGVTQKSAKVLKITLDNGEHIICTPEHKFPVYEQEFKRAEEFKVGDSMIPLYRKKEMIYSHKKDYEQYFDNASKTWTYTHRMVADYLKDTAVPYWIYNDDASNNLYEVRHHKDFNRFNNDPQNLVWMSWDDHTKYHQEYMKVKYETLKETNPEEYDNLCKRIGDGVKKAWEALSEEKKLIRGDQTSKMWKNFTEEEYTSICEKMSISAKEYITSLSTEEREIRAENSRKAFKLANIRFNDLMNSDPEFYRAVVDKRMEYWTEENRKIRADIVREWNYINWNGEKGTERKAKHSDSQQVEYTHDMLKFVINMVKGKTTHQVTADDIALALNESSLRDDLVRLNKDKNVRNWSVDEGFTPGNIRRSLVQQFGYQSWKDFRVKESLHNHTVVAIEWLDEEIPVGTLTIDGDEIYHDYHTFALSCGVFVFNSNLGEIDDLKYFNNKMARGLRVPSSYLPTGPDESSTPLSDGRVGTAMIQEFRFNQYCERLQQQIAQKLDEEFKLFLRWRGFNIDSGLFELGFNPPQNFASYRQVELDTARVNTFSSLEQLPYMSKRFILERFLGLTQEEINKNAKLWREEHNKELNVEPQGSDLRSVGISVGDIESDLETGEKAEASTQQDIEGPEVAGPVSAEAPAPVSPAGGMPSAPPT